MINILLIHVFLLIASYSQSEHIFDQRTVLAPTKWDFYMFIDSMDMGISKTIRAQGQHNSQIIQLLLYYFDKDQAFVHVGSHIGLQTLVIGRQMKKYDGKSKVYAFEPQFFAYTLLSKSIVFNNLQQFIDIFHVGIAAQNGKGQLAALLTDTGKAQIMKAQTKRKADSKETVNLMTLNQVIPLEQEIGLVLVTGSKMQVQILQSLLLYLQLSKDLVIVTDWKYGINPQKDINTIINIINKLQNMNYKIYQIVLHTGKAQFKEQFGFNSLANIQNSKLLLLPQSKQLPK